MNVKPVIGYEGIYEVSDCGRVFRIAGGRGARSGKELSQSRNRKGYLVVCLSKNCFVVMKRVSRLVAESFLDNKIGLPEVNHKDGNKGNNHVDNLEWSSSVNNNSHAHRTGLNKITGDKAMREVIGTHLVTGAMVRFHSIGEARRNGFHDSTISACCKGKRPHHAGYLWQYA